MTTVANCSTIQEAHLIKIRLESRGIEVFIPDEFTAQMDPPLFYATTSGVRIQVADEDVEAAKRVLAEKPDEDKNT